MKVLVVTANYPHPGNLLAGNFNERSVAALKHHCDKVEVLVSRPYVPPLLSLVPKWRAYASASRYEVRDGVSIYRPAYLQLPRVGSAIWLDKGAYFFCRHTARKRHRVIGFDSIVSFDVLGAGGLAWRLAQDLRIPASGWATGEDVRVPASSSLGRVATRALERLDVVFYQSHELLGKAAGLLGVQVEQMPQDRHMVCPRGVEWPRFLPRAKLRNQVRSELGFTEDDIVVLSTGRITREKGVFDLLDAFFLAAAKNARIAYVMVGSHPAFDETATVQKTLDRTPALDGRVRLLPACGMHKVWEYLCAADIFAFSSHHEGMPNSLLEAMVMGLPAVAFGIPPILEIDAGTGALLIVPPFDTNLFARAILRLAASPDTRVRISKRAKVQVKNRFVLQKNMARALDHIARIVERHRRVSGVSPSGHHFKAVSG